MRKKILFNLLLMLGFGLLSMLLGSIRFYVPGMDGGGTDMREIGILLSVVFLPHWLYLPGVALIGSLSIPMHNLEISTLCMHMVGISFSWLFYRYASRKTKNPYILGGAWAIMVVFYYLIFLIPTLLLVFYFFGTIRLDEFFSNYRHIVFNFRYELFTSIMVTSLFVILYRITRILDLRNKQLQEALRKAQESDRLKTEFLLTISHEIRTPLNGIVGFTNLLADGKLTQEERNSYVEVVNASGEQLLILVKDMLDLSRIRAGQVEPLKSAFPVCELLDSMASFYRKKALEKSLQFESEYSPEVTNCRMYTDRNILQQILDNLLLNAIKFTSSGKIGLSAHQDGSSLILMVSDTGRGIAPEDQVKIFSPFSKIEAGSEKFLPGTGIGLSLTKSLTELLGGTISVQSERGKGSVFTLRLPIGT